MSNLHGYRAACGVYYLLLGVWAGAILMAGLGAGIAFHTVRGLEPSIHAAPYADPALAEQGANILAGAVVGGQLHALLWLQVVCAAGVLLMVLLQHSLFRDRVRPLPGGLSLLRLGLVIAAAALLAAAFFWLDPAAWDLRTRMYDVAITPEARSQARDSFDFIHQAYSRVMQAALGTLLAGLLVSPWVLIPSTRPASDALPSQPQAS